MKTEREYLKELCDTFGITVKEIGSHSRKSSLAIKRHCIMYILYKARNLSYHEIGDLMNRDHTSVVHGVRNAEFYMRHYEKVCNEVENGSIY